MSDEKKRPAAQGEHGGPSDHETVRVPKPNEENSLASEVADKSISADPDTAISFLQRWLPGGPWPLSFIVPDGKISTETFGPADVDSGRLRERLLKAASRENCHFMTNTAKGPLRKKASKSDIAQAVALHVDIDPRVGEEFAEERARILKVLQNFSPAPSAVIDSGGGFQAFWRQRTPFEIDGDEVRCADFERYNRQLALELGGDHCQSIEHLMRLPGTINLPNAKKRERGRVPALAKLVSFDPDLVYDISQFRQSRAVPDAKQKGRGTPQLRLLVNEGKTFSPREVDLDKLPKSVPDWTRVLIVKGDEEGKYKSRSEAVFAALCALVRAGVDDEKMFDILMDRDFRISDHIYDQGDPQKAALKNIRSARATAEDFVRGDDGEILATQGNIRRAIAELGVSLRYNEFAGHNFIEGLDGFAPGPLQDPQLNRLYLLIDQRFGFRARIEFFTMVVSDEARLNSFHPVREYLDTLKWDREPRLDTWLIKYGGARDSEYVRAVGAKTLVAAVRRVREPGCKFDEMLILESEQGKDKSTALAVLAVRETWFSDDLPLDAESKKVIETLSGRWIVEAGELKGMNAKSILHLKSMLSRTNDSARMSYERLRKEAPRQCVIIGTTNESIYLKDETGNRRFWPVRVQLFDTAALRRDRDQLWAEAAQREAEGESIRLDPRLWSAAAVEQAERKVQDPWVPALEAHLANGISRISARDLWSVVGVPLDRREQRHNERLGNCMRELGYERTKLRFSRGRQPEWGYARVGEKTAPPDDQANQAEDVRDDEPPY